MSADASRLVSTTLLLAALGCAHVPSPPGVPDSVSGRLETLTALQGPLTSQSLYRVDYDGSEGSGRLRIVLRLGEDGLFQLAASDPLGRALWNLTARGEMAALVDHRQRVYCVGADVVAVPDGALRELPLAAIPRVLDGLLPTEPGTASADDGRQEYEDAAGRRWTAQSDDGRVITWTLWDDGSPLVWWLEQPRGGILSHRHGSQFRWRRSVRESKVEGRLAVEIPAGYGAGACSEVSSAGQGG